MRIVTMGVVVLAFSFFLGCSEAAGTPGSDPGAANGGESGDSTGPADSTDSEAQPIVTGATKGEALSDRNGVVAVDAGFAADGVKIDIPAGFLSTECKFTAAIAQVSGSAISTSVSVSSAGLVSCKKLVQERENVPPTTEGCTASYTVVCVDSE